LINFALPFANFIPWFVDLLTLLFRPYRDFTGAERENNKQWQENNEQTLRIDEQ
jgi:hypothetical protein